VGWVKYDVLLFIITYATFYAVIVYMFLLSCIFCFFVNFLILVCVRACVCVCVWARCLFLLSVGFVLLSVVYFV
jgi:hypothetical protein